MPGRFSYRVPDSNSFLAALQTYLRARERPEAAALLERASCAVCPSTSFSSNRWQALSTTVTFYVPADRLPRFTGSVRKELWLAAEAVMPKDAGLDVGQVLVAPLLETPAPEDGIGLNGGVLAGRGAVEHDGLRFRSWAETRIHEALKRHPVLFFPNPAALLGGSEDTERKEPDFLVCWQGKWGVLEVMGEPYHPAATAMKDHERARLFKDHGLRIVEFYDAARCLREPEAVVDDFLRRLAES